MNLKKRIFNYGLPIFAIVMLLFAISQISNRSNHQSLEPTFTPASTILKGRIAGIGIVEPKNKIIKINTHISGIIEEIFVVTGQIVKIGDPLFSIDSREIKSKIETAEACCALAQVKLEDAKNQLSFYEKIANPKAVSKQEVFLRRFAVKQRKAELKEAKAILNEFQILLSKLTVKSPVDGEILKINRNVGEYADLNMAPTGFIVAIGDTSTLHVRVEIDETDVHRIHANLPASGLLRGREKETLIPLKFIKIEPLLNPKRFFIGDGNERIDTRVLEVIYSFPNDTLPVYPGQQMDVFIDVSSEK